MNKESISKKLAELFELHKSGALTKEEFENLKQELLSGNDQGTSNLDKDKQKKPIQWKKIVGICLMVFGTLLILGYGFLKLYIIREAAHYSRSNPDGTGMDTQIMSGFLFLFFLLFSGSVIFIGYRLSKKKRGIQPDKKQYVSSLLVVGTLFFLGSLIGLIYSISTYNHTFKAGAMAGVKDPTFIVLSSIILLFSVAITFIGYKRSKKKKGIQPDINQDVSNAVKKHKKGRIAIIATTVISLCAILAVILFMPHRDQEWNESQASKKIISELKKQSKWSSWHHRIVGFKQISFDQRIVFVAIAISNENATSDYQGEYSIFEFDESNKWKLGNMNTAFTYAYDSDSLAILSKIHKVSNNNYGIEIESGGSGMGGRTSISKHIYAFLNGDLKVIFAEEKQWQNNYYGKFNLEFIDEGNEYYDILVWDDANPRRRIHLSSIYEFDGLSYIREE